MYRSGSSTRVSDELLFFPQPSSTGTTASEDTAEQQQHRLPTYTPESHPAKKEKIRLRSAESAVHIIPLLLLLCAVVLWFFSTPVDITKKGDSVAGKVRI
ncbi:hypothetical protein BUALT_Bualt10G0018300 [Buddleja alternifolia]|uniref:Uncharacterized protein n=1 Tax=Buddleja alternifolia TaxID=168488 RepID=A0AAV6X1X2_9LAMI|nr:hypothetical protein BUALT_Bualt10G0018300 [Buddleja alternifolia]